MPTGREAAGTGPLYKGGGTGSPTFGIWGEVREFPLRQESAELR